MTSVFVIYVEVRVTERGKGEMERVRSLPKWPWQLVLGQGEAENLEPHPASRVSGSRSSRFGHLVLLFLIHQQGTGTEAVVPALPAVPQRWPALELSPSVTLFCHVALSEDSVGFFILWE